jgi:hypothetical protein
MLPEGMNISFPGSRFGWGMQGEYISLPGFGFSTLPPMEIEYIYGSLYYVLFIKEGYV